MHSTTRINATNFFGTLALTLSIILAMLALVAGPALAHGNGSPADCMSSDMLEVSGDTATAPEGQIITAICFKAGQFHSGVITSDGDQTGTYEKNRNETDVPYSYTVSGLGTDSVTVTQNDGPGLSHVDYTVGDEPEPETVDVCDTTTGEIITVDVADADSDDYAAVDSEECQEQEPETVDVCDTESGEIINVDVADADDEGYAAVDSDECTDVESETVEVCDTDSGEIIEVAEENAGNERYAAVDSDACDEVQGITEEPDPEPTVDEEPETQPATEVKGEQVASTGELPNTGTEHVIMLLLASALFALGGSFLLLSDRRRTVLG